MIHHFFFKVRWNVLDDETHTNGFAQTQFVYVVGEYNMLIDAECTHEAVHIVLDWDVRNDLTWRCPTDLFVGLDGSR